MNQPLSSIEVNTEAYEFKKYQLKYVEDVDDEFKSSRWNKLVEAPKTYTAYDLLIIEPAVKISTTIPELDFALDDGFSTGQINELTGGPGSGKTQLCFRISIHHLLTNVEGNVFYLLTNSNFAPQRLKELIKLSNEYQKASEEEKIKLIERLMKRIKILEVSGITDLFAAVKFLEYTPTFSKHLDVVIIDSIWIPFKKFEQSVRTLYIFRLFANMQKLSVKYGFTIIVTNNLTTVFGSNDDVTISTYFGSGYFHRLSTRIKLVKDSENAFIAKIEKCSYSSKNQSFNFSII